METRPTKEAIATIEIMTMRMRESNLLILREQQKTNGLLEKLLKLEQEKETRRKISE